MFIEDLDCTPRSTLRLTDVDVRTDDVWHSQLPGLLERDQWRRYTYTLRVPGFVDVPDDSLRGSFTAYEITFTLRTPAGRPYTFRARRRFSEWRKLHADLGSSVGKFPVVRPFKLMPDEDAKQKRAAALERWLEERLQPVDGAPAPEVLQFVGMHGLPASAGRLARDSSVLGRTSLGRTSLGSFDTTQRGTVRETFEARATCEQADGPIATAASAASSVGLELTPTTPQARAAATPDETDNFGRGSFRSVSSFNSLQPTPNSTPTLTNRVPPRVPFVPFVPIDSPTDDTGMEGTGRAGARGAGGTRGGASGVARGHGGGASGHGGGACPAGDEALTHATSGKPFLQRLHALSTALGSFASVPHFVLSTALGSFASVPLFVAIPVVCLWALQNFDLLCLLCLAQYGVWYAALDRRVLDTALHALALPPPLDSASLLMALLAYTLERIRIMLLPAATASAAAFVPASGPLGRAAGFNGASVRPSPAFVLWISVALACGGGGSGDGGGGDGGGLGGGLGGGVGGGMDGSMGNGGTTVAEELMAAAEVAMTDATTDFKMLKTALVAGSAALPYIDRETTLGVGSAVPGAVRPVSPVTLAEGALFALVLVVWAAALLLEWLEAAEVTRRMAAEAAEAAEAEVLTAARASASDGCSSLYLGSSRRRGRLSWLEHAAPICRAGTCAALAYVAAWRQGGTGAWLVAALTLSILVHELAEASELARWARLSSRLRAGAPYVQGAPPPRAADAPLLRRQALPLMRSQSPLGRRETLEHPVRRAVSSAPELDARRSELDARRSELDARRSELDEEGWEVLDDEVTSLATDPQYARLAPRGHQPRSRRLSHEKRAGARPSAAAAARGEGVGGSSSSGGSGGGGDAGGGALADTTTTATAPTAATSPLELPATLMSTPNMEQSATLMSTHEATPHPTSRATSPAHGGGGGSSSGDRSASIPNMDRSASIPNMDRSASNEPLQTLQRNMALTSPMLSMAERLLRCLPHELRELARPIAVELLAVGVEKGAIDNDKFRSIVQALGATLSLVLTRTLLDPAGRMKLWLGLKAFADSAPMEGRLPGVVSAFTRQRHAFSIGLHGSLVMVRERRTEARVAMHRLYAPGTSPPERVQPSSVREGDVVRVRLPLFLETGESR